MLTVDHGANAKMSRQKNISNLLRFYTDNIFAFHYFVRIFVIRFQVFRFARITRQLLWLLERRT